MSVWKVNVLETTKGFIEVEADSGQEALSLAQKVRNRGNTRWGSSTCRYSIGDTADEKLYTDFNQYRNCCIGYNLFSAGTNEQFDKVFQMLQTGVSLSDLSLVTWVCSSGVTLEEVTAILEKEL